MGKIKHKIKVEPVEIKQENIKTRRKPVEVKQEPVDVKPIFSSDDHYINFMYSKASRGKIKID
jgi:hypothetical protein